MLSALLMVMSQAKEPCEIQRTKEVREPFINMTLLMIRQFGLNAGSNSENGILWTMPSDASRNSLVQSGGVYSIEADASSASYFLALPVVKKGSVTLRNMPFPHEDPKGNLQGDGYNFVKVMRNMGATIKPFEQPRPNSFLAQLFSWLSIDSDERPGTSTPASNRSDGLIISYDHPSRSKGLAQEFREFSDTFLTLAAITPILTGRKTTISGIAHTRKQETDRIKAMATELTKIIGKENVAETEDTLEITAMNRSALSGLKRRMLARKTPLVIETYNDHRVAMSFAILGCYDLKKNGKPWLSIKNPNCCAKTFPNFFEVLEKVRVDSHSR